MASIYSCILPCLLLSLFRNHKDRISFPAKWSTNPCIRGWSAPCIDAWWKSPCNAHGNHFCGIWVSSWWSGRTWASNVPLQQRGVMGVLGCIRQSTASRSRRLILLFCSALAGHIWSIASISGLASARETWTHRRESSKGPWRRLRQWNISCMQKGWVLADIIQGDIGVFLLEDHQELSEQGLRQLIVCGLAWAGDSHWMTSWSSSEHEPFCGSVVQSVEKHLILCSFC